MPPPKPFKVLISGAGIAGLTLAVLLERAGIDYELFERASTVRPLGTALAIGPSVLPVIEQLGLLEKFKELSMENDFVSNYTEDMVLTSTISYSNFPTRTGYASHVISRPRLYDFLYSQVPSSKVHMGKRVVSISQDLNPNRKSEEQHQQESDNGVTLTFADGTTARGDILVGADGAYSGVRQSLYEQLDKLGMIAASDLEELPCTSICLVGQTKPLSTEKFPYLLQKYCKFENISGNDKPYTWLTLSMSDNTICWMVIEHLYLETNRKDIAKNAEWGPAATDAMIEKVKTFPIPSGGPSSKLTMADLINETPRELISQVALEGKLFETWYAGRTVLIGDACHKMYPSAAQGANAAMQDAIVLANHLYATNSNTTEAITKAFEEFYQERVPSAKQAYETSDKLRQLFRKNRINTVIRFMIKFIPQWMWDITLDKVYRSRPQALFLPRVPDRGSIKAFPQPGLGIEEGS